MQQEGLFLAVFSDVSLKRDVLFSDGDFSTLVFWAAVTFAWHAL